MGSACRSFEVLPRVNDGALLTAILISSFKDFVIEPEVRSQSRSQFEVLSH